MPLFIDRSDSQLHCSFTSKVTEEPTLSQSKAFKSPRGPCHLSKAWKNGDSIESYAKSSRIGVKRLDTSLARTVREPYLLREAKHCDLSSGYSASALVPFSTLFISVGAPEKDPMDDITRISQLLASCVGDTGRRLKSYSCENLYFLLSLPLAVWQNPTPFEIFATI